MKSLRFLLAAFLFCAFAGVVRAEDKVVKLEDLPKNADGAYILFNGKDLTDWDGNPDFWSVQDGTITGQTTAEKPTRGNTFCIFRGGNVKDFELHCQFKLRNHNSGIQYRSKDIGNWVIHGYQADMAEALYTGILYEEGGRGILATVGQKVTIGADGKKTAEQVGNAKAIQDAIKLNQWHAYTIIAKGNHLIQKIDGTTTMELIDNQVDKRAMEGVLAFQLHAGQPMKVQFKDITLKVLD